ncbi:hypothetical protein HED49_03080 [Ochrobactrum daejeonense]|nr:hypothetical protein [Brucella daejeonensis]
MTDTLHEDGIYFGMSDEEYHADPALGSTGLKKLIGNAPDFWWDSPMNPARDDDDDTPAKIFGRQLHMCVLEGVEKFKENHAAYVNPGNVKAGKDEIAAIVAAGKVPVKFKDYSKILAASAFIKANKTLARAFEGGQPEVSVFWTVNGIRYKARFDYLQINSIVDLKSIENRSDKEFKQACRDAMASYDYIVSAGHYSDGRRQMKGLFRAGKVFGLPEGQEDWLSKVVSNPVFAFVFVFWQKRARRYRTVSCCRRVTRYSTGPQNELPKPSRTTAYSWASSVQTRHGFHPHHLKRLTRPHSRSGTSRSLSERER